MEALLLTLDVFAMVLLAWTLIRGRKKPDQNALGWFRYRQEIPPVPQARRK
jgi:hypothetical protein